MRMDYSEIRTRQQALTSAFETGTLTEAMLDREVEMVVEDPDDGPSRSIGYEWIVENTMAFARTVPDASAFLRRHLGIRDFASLAILHTELLQLLPVGERESYVRESVMRHAPRNEGWVKATLDAGVAEESLAQIVLDKLEATTEDELRCYCFLAQFLEYGMHDQPTPDSSWGVLTDDQFVEAMRICACKAPQRVLREHRKIALRLGKERLKEIVSEAVRHIDRVIAPEALESLPLDDRIAFARRLASVTGLHADSGGLAIRFVMKLMDELDDGRAVNLFEDLKPVFENAHAPSLYRAARAAAMKPRLDPKRPDRFGAADVVLKWFEQRILPKQGYEFGEVEQGVFTRKGREQTQMQVRVGRRVYVQERNQHRYFPRKGDRVLFKPSNGRSLTPSVTSVIFIPIDPTKEY